MMHPFLHNLLIHSPQSLQKSSFASARSHLIHDASHLQQQVPGKKINAPPRSDALVPFGTQQEACLLKTAAGIVQRCTGQPSHTGILPAALGKTKSH